MALLCGLFLNLVGRHVLPSFDLITQTHRDLQVIRQLEPLLLLINGKGCPALRISLPQKRSDLDLAEVGEFLLTGPLQCTPWTQCILLKRAFGFLLFLPFALSTSLLSKVFIRFWAYLTTCSFEKIVNLWALNTLAFLFSNSAS